ncbi:MAG: flavohemoglobin expression-modulating QEGLA motif protein [Bacteroidetes bacterium]|nr:MAG: flavohemoglobin expression-modulating QEGLA motif protein [Bacteroidota bacterium]
MYKLSVNEIIEKIQNREVFEADASDGSFHIKIEHYVPYVCAAIHAGHQLRDDLKQNCVLSDYERWYEEDPQTETFIASLPIVIYGKDSRYEYDLNRRPESAVYDTAWGKQVWKKPLTPEQKQKSLAKHSAFYKVIDVLLTVLENQYQSCVVYDIHSYNYKRIKAPTPVFNIGSERINKRKFGHQIKHWARELSKIQIPGVQNTVEINGPFKGRGYLLEFVNQTHPNSLTLATEVKKIYCDEETGEYYPEVIHAISEQLKTAILNNTQYYIKHKTPFTVVVKNQLLSGVVDKDLLKLDEELYRITKKIEILDYVNPVNLEREKQAFFHSKYKRNPKFNYRHLNINPFEIKRKLYELPVENITDVSIQKMYKDTINSYADKVDLLATLGTEKFRYNSLRYFGAPDERILKNARFLLSLPETEPEIDNIDAVTAKKIVEEEIKHYAFDCKVELSSQIAAKAMVLNYKQKLIIRKDAYFSKISLHALAHHEIGVHMVTTLNAVNQPLNIFKIGLPVNTKTQEGLAVLSEYLSGNLNIFRLKQLGARVIGINMMLNGYSFADVFEYMMEHYTNDINEAFTLVSRIYRGGGFTKDYLYLDGFKELLNFFHDNNKLDNLLVGKTHIKYLPVINEMIERGIIFPPQYITRAFQTPREDNEILRFIIEGVKL